jgi:hypothetical protein
VAVAVVVVVVVAAAAVVVVVVVVAAAAVVVVVVVVVVVALPLNSVAGLFESKGEYDRAMPLYEECLAKRKRVLGEDHPDTRSIQNIRDEPANFRYMFPALFLPHKTSNNLSISCEISRSTTGMVLSQMKIWNATFIFWGVTLHI